MYLHQRIAISRRCLLACAAISILATTSLAAVASDAQLSAPIALYSGADRMQKLIEGAKKEGEFTIYSSAPTDDMTALTTAFEKKYGIKAKVWRASSEKVLGRGITEARGNRFDADVYETNGPELEALHREKLLQVVKSPSLADLVPQAILPHGEWVSTRINIFTAAYNTKLIKKEDLPKTYADLLNPKWKGKLGIEAEDADWFAGVIADLGEEAGLKLFRDIVASNGLSVRKGHTLLTNLVASGEVPIALTVYNYKAEQLKNKGAPIDWFVIGKNAIARPNGIGVARKSHHPHAAVLFHEFCLTDAQQIFLARDFVPTNKKIESPLTKIPLKFVDVKTSLDDDAKWTKLYTEIITKQSK
jgi:iron(III) transport system substrate-binding protein